MIEGLEIFERIRVYGKEIPSDITIFLVLHELKKTRDKSNLIHADNAISQKIRNFIDTNNAIVREMEFMFNHDDECHESAQIGLKYKANYQDQCELIGADFLTLWYFFASVSWFTSVMGHLEIPNRSDMSEDMIKHANTFKKTGAYVRDSRYIDDKSNLVRFKEYREAISFIGDFVSFTSELSRTNQKMKELLIERDNILREVAKVDYGNPVRICRFCMSVFDVRKSSGKWKHCGSSECERAYRSANKEKNHPKRLWVHDPTALLPCVGSCGSDRKQLNRDRVCKGCYVPFS